MSPLELSCPTLSWSCCVRSSSNPADLPSRGRRRDAEELFRSKESSLGRLRMSCGSLFSSQRPGLLGRFRMGVWIAIGVTLAPGKEKSAKSSEVICWFINLRFRYVWCSNCRVGREGGLEGAVSVSLKSCLGSILPVPPWGLLVGNWCDTGHRKTEEHQE